MTEISSGRARHGRPSRWDTLRQRQRRPGPQTAPPWPAPPAPGQQTPPWAAPPARSTPPARSAAAPPWATLSVATPTAPTPALPQARLRGPALRWPSSRWLTGETGAVVFRAGGAIGVAVIAFVIAGWSPGVVGILTGVLTWLLLDAWRARSRHRPK